MKIGDLVVMNDKYRVTEKNKDKVFVVCSEPWNVCGTECVLLEGYRGGYAKDGLTVVNDAAIRQLRQKSEVNGNSGNGMTRVMKFPMNI